MLHSFYRGEEKATETILVRLLHTSDWHLGQHFYGRSLVSDQEYVLDQMINLVRDLNPDVMVVAGDVFHQRRPGAEALALFHDTLNRLLNLGTILVFLSGPSDDFKALHLDSRWVREAGIYLVDDATQVLSSLSFRGAKDNFDVNTWCLPYPKASDLTRGKQHPALLGHALVEKVVQRLNPTEVNLFVGYAWAQGGGRTKEFGNLVAPGGQPLEKRLLDFFDVSALGGRHSPGRLGACQAHYSGSLLCYEPEAEERSRSVTFIEIEDKNKVSVDQYPLRPRRALRMISGSCEQLLAEGSALRSDDLIVLRSEDRELTPEQRSELRILGPNIVSVELPGLQVDDDKQIEGEPSPVAKAFTEFAKEVSKVDLDEQCLSLIEELEEQL